MLTVIRWLGSRLHVAGVRTGFGFRQSERGHLVASGQWRHPLFFLLFGSKQLKRPQSNRVMRVHKNSRRTTVTPDNLHDFAIAILPHARAAMLFGDRHSEDADVAKAFDNAVTNFGFGINLNRIDEVQAELFRFLNHRFRGFDRPLRKLRIWHDRFSSKSAKIKMLGKAFFFRSIKEKLFGLFDLFFLKFCRHGFTFWGGSHSVDATAKDYAYLPRKINRPTPITGLVRRLKFLTMRQLVTFNIW